MRTILLVSAFLVANYSHAIERKLITDVDPNMMTKETQTMTSTPESIDLIWWITPEFWEATLRQNTAVTPAQVDQILTVVDKYSILGVVQADVSPFGAFSFYDKDTVMNGIKVEAIDADGNAQIISHTEPTDPDMRLMLDQMRPVLAQAMGNLGENFYFFPMPNLGEDGKRIMSPYESGQIRVALQRGEQSLNLEVELPVDSLFVPRTCPNGKTAHVSWVHCPWSGKRLPK